MALLDILNVGTALSAGGIKGFADGTGIGLESMSYILPIVGTLTLPFTTTFFQNDLDLNPVIPNTFAAAGLTGIGYCFGKSAAYLLNHYN